ncbi:hypothetical protein SIM91_17950 [Rhodococcus opacus]|uniref:hypothetical protein n=1 Tax=Rhodococcus opacus TaxID=37919 RepID=UPI0002A2F4F6|nr:hypothetical protein [Rhodococcus opacus]ELB88104.1 hypothetical protein Rwratislav_36344 [Rhodococcus wratislaviensis IFP 2016]MDX5965161.1 hypothetical protein [Rhodococcus opacus]NKY74542.1 hypothetical protein [Rhodococcus opacus]CAG7620297.1 hypothetical protein E143388_06231 [Rhodococcus opacus]
MTPTKSRIRSKRDDDLVLEFGNRWAVFGGGSAEDIFVTFGWTEAQYFARLQVLAGRRFPPFDDTLRHRLLDVCAERLQRTDHPPSSAAKGHVDGSASRPTARPSPT